jgi:hypothetical protein
MSCLLLGLILNLPVPNSQVSPQITAAVHALLDFLYLAHLPSHSQLTLAHMDELLTRFHNNKDIFVDLRICNHFNISKIHSLIHYTPSIQLFGTTDNYNTEQTECLHIDTTKLAFEATNCKDKLNQMTSWLDCCKKVQIHSLFLKWQQCTDGDTVET